MRFIILTLCALGIFASSQAFAQTTIAVVNVERLYKDSKAAKSIKSQQDKLTKDLEATLKKEAEKFDKKKADFEKQSSELSSEDLKKKAEKLQKEFNQASKDLQKRRVKIQKALLKAEEKMRSEIVKISGDIAKENKYDVVLPNQAAIIVNSDLDITDAVLKKLNANLKTVKVKVD